MRVAPLAVQVSPEDVEATAQRLEAQAHDLDLVMSRLAPNLKASAMLDDVERKLATEAAELAAARTLQSEAEAHFREISTARRSLFEEAFAAVKVSGRSLCPIPRCSPSLCTLALRCVNDPRVYALRTSRQDAIDAIYKDLTISASHPTGGTARLSLENPDDPFDSASLPLSPLNFVAP